VAEIFIWFRTKLKVSPSLPDLTFFKFSYDIRCTAIVVPYILESNPQLFAVSEGQNTQMRIRIACGLDSRSRAGFWKKMIEPLYVS
jgi:hypothetical protein